MAKHKDLEFHVDTHTVGESTHILKTFNDAAGLAISIAASSGRDVTIDVLCWSRGAAIVWAGGHGAEVYDEDPDASVHDRIVIRAESIGRVA